MLKLFKILGVFLLCLILIPLIVISFLALPCLVVFLLYEFGASDLVLVSIGLLLLFSEVFTTMFIIENWNKI